MTLEERISLALQDPARMHSADFRDRVLAALPAQRPQPWYIRCLRAAIGAAAVLAVVLVLGSSMTPRNGVAPVGTPRSPDATGTAVLTETPSAPAMVLALDADGIPVEIDEEVVLRGDDITERIQASPDEQPFLIGGWATGRIIYRCAARPSESPAPFELLLACGAPSVLIMGGSDRNEGVVVRAVRDPTLPRPGRVVLRVHVHDALAAHCPEAYTVCDETVVLDDVVWTEP